MNLLYNKNLEDVIDSLAHEMAHIVLGVGDEGHGPIFNRKWEILRKKINQMYFKDPFMRLEKGRLQ
jgi:hypothetical protein